MFLWAHSAIYFNITLYGIPVMLPIHKRMIYSECRPPQAQFADQVHFNGRFDGSPRIPNTCNVSLLGPKLQGEMKLS